MEELDNKAPLEQPTNNIPPFRKEVVEAYLDYLIKKFDALEGEPFSTKARLAVRNEIEAMKVVLEQAEMDDTWSRLDQTFGLKSKPVPKDYTYHISGNFRSKFSKKELDFDEAY